MDTSTRVQTTNYFARHCFIIFDDESVVRTDGRFIQNEMFVAETITPHSAISNCHRATDDTLPHKSEENISSTSAGTALLSQWLPSSLTSAPGRAQGQTNRSTIVVYFPIDLRQTVYKQNSFSMKVKHT